MRKILMDACFVLMDEKEEKNFSLVVFMFLLFWRGRRSRVAGFFFIFCLLAAQREKRNLVDPASSHMLVSKIKPCMSQYKFLHDETAKGSLKQL